MTSAPNPLELAVETSVRYLGSPEALRSIDANPYWPKWDSPWWHMMALHEMGRGKSIPRPTALYLAGEIRKHYPQDGTPIESNPCPCELGNIFRVLHGSGIEVDRELPWVRRWFMDHQMPDGGLSCDEEAYRSDPPASSIVGTIAPLEAILYCTDRPFTPEEENFLDAGARCLIERKLLLGCSAPHNAAERTDEADWLKPCFPRFYFYDILRGLTFILRWAERRRKPIPASALEGALSILREKASNDRIRIERHSFEGAGTQLLTHTGEWKRRQPATFFPLLEEVSRIGQESPSLTRHWREAKERLEALTRDGLIA